MTHDAEHSNAGPHFLTGPVPAARGDDSASAGGPGDDSGPSRWDEVADVAMMDDPHQSSTATYELRAAVVRIVRVLGLREALRRLSRP
jgi:hypothetical protein